MVRWIRGQATVSQHTDLPEEAKLMPGVSG